MPDVRGDLARALRAALDDLGASGVEAVVEPCARPELGDWSTPAALRCAAVLRRSPLQIAQELAALLKAAPAVEHIGGYSVSAPGYVNARLEDRTWAPAVIREALARDPADPVPLPHGHGSRQGKALIEHTSINTNKAAHIGHLRNACIGDTVARLLRRTGSGVEVQNYIDDTGVQVADVVVGLRELGIEQQPEEPFDQFCSRVYVEVVRRQETEPALRALTVAVLKAIEERDNETARFAKQLAGRIVDAHLATMARFGIGYDLLSWESDILELGFWDAAFTLLRAHGAIVLADNGRNVGCWVMPLVGVDADAPEADAAAGGEPATDDRSTKVLVKSDGVATYTAKDIAYQLWKFGLLDVDFHYRRWSDDPHSPATTQAHAGGATLDGRGFGHADHVITVIDVRQTYPQMVVRAALARLGHTHEAANSVHLGYEVVALTPRAAAELGVAADDGAAAVALSGRHGIEVRADDLLDRAVAMLRPKAADAATAHALAVGGVRYYLEKFTLPTIIAFDFGDALRVTGDSGVYLQYAHARAAGVLRKVSDDGGEPEPPAALQAVERTLLRRIEDYPTALAEAAGALAPAVLAAYAFELASALTDVYEHTPAIIREADAGARRFRRALVAATRATLADALSVLGIPALERV
ncbi:MAG TPA: arginine--tRNA ligase [Candidatus Dormibacteraeota bacterium]